MEAVALGVAAPLLVRNDRGDITSKTEYARRYAAARREAARMSSASRRKLAEVYLEASKEAAVVVARSLERGLSSLTVERWAVLASKLKDAADTVAHGTETVAKALVTQAAPLFPEIDADFVWSAAKLTGADRKITRAGLGRIVSGINSRVLASMTTRLWSDGYTFSERIWKTGTYTKKGKDGIERTYPISVRGDYMERIKMTITAGIAQGRDPVKIAKDIQVYTADGKVALGKRWGGLERGTAEFAKRIPGRLDWRAQRLVRSELNMSLQDAGVAAGEANPGCDGFYDWVLQLGRIHTGCECPDLAAGGPYTAETMPTYPHSNCGCHPEPRLRDMVVFTADLARWAKGESVDYLDEWYVGTYKAAA